MTKPDAEGTGDKYEMKFNVPAGENEIISGTTQMNLAREGVAIEFHSSENCPYKKILDEVKKQELLSRTYYVKMRDENPMFEKWITDVIRHCNGILNMLKEKK